MSWHKIFGVFVLILLFGAVVRPGMGTIAEAVGTQAPIGAEAPAVGVQAAGMPVVVRSGGAALYDSPNGAETRRLETGAIVQAISRTPTGDWIFVEVEAGIQGWLSADKLVSVNPAALPVYGRPQAEQLTQPAASSTPAQEASPTPEPNATAIAPATPTTQPTVMPTATATAMATATAVPPTATLVVPTPTAVVAAAQPAQANGVNPFLRRVGVVGAVGATLVDMPSGNGSVVLHAGEIVTILQRSEDDGWLQVARADGSTGWIVRQELITSSIAKVPRAGEAKAATTATSVSETAPTGAPMPAGESVVMATVRTDGSRLNVRSGPGSGYPIIAKADNRSSYPALSTDVSTTWVQIKIAEAADGMGWVSARFVALDGELSQ